jgi:FlaA1/EpsC-like NDP-sugar epimerase
MDSMRLFFMWNQWRNPKLYLMLLSDVFIFVLAHVLAYLYRFDGVLTAYWKQQIMVLLPYIVPFKLIVFYSFGAYRGMWRYTNLADCVTLGKASLFSLVCIATGLLYFNRFEGFSRTVVVLDALLTFVLTAALRVGIRSYFVSSGNRKAAGAKFFPLWKSPEDPQSCKRVLIIGAGVCGEKMLREVQEDPYLEYIVVGFLDDNPGKRGRCVHDVPVLGAVDKLPKICQTHYVDEVLIAIPSATGAQMRRVVEICKESGVSYKTLPAMNEIIDGKVSIKALRDVNYNDLLGRPQVHLDTAGIRDYVEGKVVLVTGCGGSIGSELCRQLLRFNPGFLVLVDASEANLFYIQMELHHEYNFHAYETVLGRVQHRNLMEKVFNDHHPQVVFHAGACKHVPMLERNPWEAVFNNVMASSVLMETAEKFGVERFVLVSTDKAVRPTNVMGASKRVTELLLQTRQESATRFMAVRFGNAVGSSGSVIPLFRRQIEQGGPVTVTHPDMTRYFMTIPEAAQLILQAGAMGEGGEIFILEMGTPVKIVDIAKDLVRLSGKQAGKDIEITFIGLREGEKLCEELITSGEGIVNTVHDKIMVLRPNGVYNGCRSGEEMRGWLDDRVKELYGVALRHDILGIKQKLLEIVPEYTPYMDDPIDRAACSGYKGTLRGA